MILSDAVSITAKYIIYFLITFSYNYYELKNDAENYN